MSRFMNSSHKSPSGPQICGDVISICLCNPCQPKAMHIMRCSTYELLWIINFGQNWPDDFVAYIANIGDCYRILVNVNDS